MLLIFDWDGTLSNSTDRIITCMQQAAKDCGKRVCDYEAVRNIIGLGLAETMDSLYPELDAEGRGEIHQAFVAHFLSADQEASPLFDGVLEGLHRLRQNNYLLAIATGKSRRGLDRTLNKLNLTHFFHATRCADETASKPHPLMLAQLLSELSREPEQAVMVGDTEYDMAMASELGIAKVAVSYGAHTIERLKTHQPQLCVDHFSEFVDWIEAKS